MGVAFTLEQNDRSNVRQVFDDLITEFGKTCKLFYPPKEEPCACSVDPIGKKPANRWTSGSPVPINKVSACPMCGGGGVRTLENTVTITIAAVWEPSKFWIKIPGELQVPTGMVQTKIFAYDLPKVLQSRKMQLEVEFEGINKYVFVLEGEPVDVFSIIQGRYYVCIWKRAG